MRTRKRQCQVLDVHKAPVLRTTMGIQKFKLFRIKIHSRIHIKSFQQELPAVAVTAMALIKYRYLASHSTFERWFCLQLTCKYNKFNIRFNESIETFRKAFNIKLKASFGNLTDSVQIAFWWMWPNKIDSEQLSLTVRLWFWSHWIWIWTQIQTVSNYIHTVNESISDWKFVKSSQKWEFVWNGNACRHSLVMWIIYYAILFHFSTVNGQ